jgi:hypothetical protein
VSKLFLYLTNDRLVALLIKGKTVIGRENFAASEADSPTFEKYLEAHKRIPTYLLTDLIEEDFRIDTIPHLRGSDHDAIVERKLAQLYRASPYRHAIVQGREEEGRRDDRIFMHAVTNPDLVKPIIAQLTRIGIPLEGIFSSAVLSSRLLKELDIFSPHTMLVTIVPDFGLRQTYFKDKLVKFSRLTPILYEESRSVGDLIAAETSRTWQYLDSLRYFAENESLEVCILVHARDKVMLQDAIRTFPLLRYRFIDINDVATKLKLAPAPASSHAEEVLCHLYAQGALENHFAEKEDTRYATFRRARMGLFAATVAVLALSVAVTAFNLFQATKISDQIEARGLSERAAQTEFQTVIGSMREQKMATDTVRDTSTFFNSQLRPSPATPSQMLKEFAVVLSAFPNVTLNQVVWTVSNDPSIALSLPQAGSGAGQGRAGVLPASSSAAAGASGVAGAAAAQAVSNLLVIDASAPLAGNKYHIALLGLAIEPFDGDLRKAIADIEKFRAQVATLQGYQVSVVSMPVDTTSQVKLKVVDSSKVNATTAPFSVRLIKQVPNT